VRRRAELEATAQRVESRVRRVILPPWWRAPCTCGFCLYGISSKPLTRRIAPDNGGEDHAQTIQRHKDPVKVPLAHLNCCLLTSEESAHMRGAKGVSPGSATFPALSLPIAPSAPHPEFPRCAGILRINLVASMLHGCLVNDVPEAGSSCLKAAGAYSG
jgi:hypothetical protein